MAKRLPAAHPGEVLREEFLGPIKSSPHVIARAVGVSRTRIERYDLERTQDEMGAELRKITSVRHVKSAA